jgi:hypothetical protein
VEIGDVPAVGLASSSMLSKCPAPSATKLPARKKRPEPFVPDIENAKGPCKEELEYPESVTASVAVAVGESWAAAVTVTVRPIGGVRGGV